jgi:hypothetical protein
MMYYALNVALILAGCFLFYKTLLHKETYFPLNRFILLGCLVLSFSLPLIPVPAQWSLRKVETERANLETTIPTDHIKQPSLQTPQVKNVAQATPATSEKASIFKDISIVKLLLWAYWLGVVVFGINFLFQLALLLWRGFRHPFIQDGRYRIVELSGDQAPCSFGNNIYINPEKYDWDTYTQIILHEKIHIQQGHSYDIILAELALIFQWFNPFAWFYRKAMEDNLEFLTDDELLSKEDVEKASYQMSLVKVSAPHFPMSLTTNYNQSILKKRLIMMNAKKSNLNSTWKYLCIVPLLLVFVSLLNEPVVYGKSTAKISNNKFASIPNKGTWFATIKGDKIKIRFEDADNLKENNSNSEFELADFKNLPRETRGKFSLTRDAGTMEFTGKFEGNVGMGEYEFNSSDQFVSFLKQEGIETKTEKDAIVFFLVDLKKDYITMLKKQGYDRLGKNDLIPLAALHISESYIVSLKKTGITDLTVHNLIPFKALNIDAAYIEEIKKSGYRNISASKLISLKAQNISGADIQTARESRNVVASDQSKPSTAINPNKKQAAAAAVNNDDDDALGSMIAKKVLNVTAAYIKGFTDLGYKFSDETYISMKALGVTPEFYKSFEKIGFNTLTPELVVGLKAVGVTPEEASEYKKLNFKKLEIEDILGARATGVTPSFVIEMRKKGRNYSSLDKYISMKVLALGDN